MPITIDLATDSANDLSFAVSPLVELGWAWHVLVGVDHHPDRADWAASVHAVLPEDLADGLAAWSFAVRAVRATLLVDPTFVPFGRWEDQLAGVSRMPAEKFAAVMLRPLLRVRGRSGNLTDPRLRNGVVGLARARGSSAVRVVQMLLDDPESARCSLVDILARCWSLFFQAEWESAVPALRGEAEARSRLCVRNGWLAALRNLSPAVKVEQARRIVIDKVQSKRLTVAGRGLVLVCRS